MTPEEAEAIIIDRLVPKYLKQPGVVTTVDGWQELTTTERGTVDTYAAENQNLAAMRILQIGRRRKALAMAQERAATIVADGNINISEELDDLI